MVSGARAISETATEANLVAGRVSGDERIGYRLTAIGYRLSATGYRLSANGYSLRRPLGFLLAADKPDTRASDDSMRLTLEMTWWKSSRSELSR